MKKLIILAVLCAAITGFAAAGGLVFQLGAGYHSTYIGEIPDSAGTALGELKTMPLGLGAYIGLGYGFGEKKLFSVGLEFAPSWDISFNPLGANNFGYAGRLFLKMKPADMFTLTGFAGYGGNLLSAIDEGSLNNANPQFGGRLTLFFLYIDYAAVLTSDWKNLAANQIGIGFAFFK